MPTDYRAVSAYNEEQLGKDRASRMSQVSMYADTAHFVFEILQNADDAGATEIVFEVSDERLVIEHNGSAFSSDDVKAISYFGKGKTDITKIGHFGLGFKSVFAYTASPRVHSGDENFEITNLYSLRGVSPPPDLERGKTRFVLPFDHAATQPDYIEAGRLKKGATARKEITAKLAKLIKEKHGKNAETVRNREMAESALEAGQKRCYCIAFHGSEASPESDNVVEQARKLGIRLRVIQY